MKKALVVLGLGLALSSAAQAQTIYGSGGFLSSSYDGASTFSGFAVNAGFGLETGGFGDVDFVSRVNLGYSAQRTAGLGISGFNFGGDFLAKYQAAETSFYGGPAVRYMFGNAKTDSGDSFSAISFGYGLLLGFQYNIDPSLGLFVEGLIERTGTTVGSLIGNTATTFGVKVGVAFEL